ncbi:amidohydrolase [Conexibacter woesei]|uniref:Amidohydrolase 3 n=1 Tax=Conexibacter woesei (strain DSM 14684 / CCUG 47730 / CIP 108061 / JCM 11494 / NBRC 100937 / ID131577) TaxID=469383 RepID=D3F6I6_CONWI|nr:amidohydrolase [Conexibacter woesei]ADB50753.1 Amidohydrolase 3 [Conexibacter woesei DSM 14684]
MKRKRLFTARRIRTLDPGAPIVQALVTLGGRVLEAGDADVLRARHRDAEPVDLGDATVVPGLNDAHQHLSDLADMAADLDLSEAGAASLADAERLIAARVAAAQPDDWVVVHRYDDGALGGPPLDRARLDALAPRNPLLVVHVAGHWGVANTPALAAGGIDEDSEPVDGGAHGRDADGRLNGVLYEESLFRYSWGEHRVLPEKPVEQLLDGLDAAQGRCHAVGLTSVCDAFVGPSQLALYRRARALDRLTMRVAMLVSEPVFDGLQAAGAGTDLGDERLRVSGVKAFVDGAIAGRTCAVSEPFEGTDDHGLRLLGDAALGQLVERVHAAGSRMAVHANGDVAIDALLTAYERAATAHPEITMRHRIEHCTLLTPALRARVKALGAMTLPFGSYVAQHGGRLVEWYGPERVERMFAHRDLLDDGIVVGGSSDHHAGELPPLLALQSMVTRTGLDGVPVGRSQRVSAEEALWIYTVGSARTTGEDDVKGALAPGLLADMTVLERDPCEVPGDAIAQIPVLRTVVGGETVFER